MCVQTRPPACPLAGGASLHSGRAFQGFFFCGIFGGGLALVGFVILGAGLLGFGFGFGFAGGAFDAGFSVGGLRAARAGLWYG